MNRYLKDYLTYISVIQGKSPNTKKEYEYDLTLFLKYMKLSKLELELEELDKIDIEDIDLGFIKGITLEDIYDYLEYCQAIRKNGPKARARKVSSIRAFFGYLTRKKKYFKEDPTKDLETPKLGKRTPVYITLDEVKILYSGINQLHYYRDFCILTIFLNCGIRLSELAGIDLDSIHNGELSVIGKGNKQRTIHLNKFCLEAINDYLVLERPNLKNADEQKALFLSQKGNRLSPKTIQDMVKILNNKSGLLKAKLSPHKLRHTMATLIYQETRDLISLQQLLGHESISTTQIYTHVNSDTLKGVVESNPLNDINIGARRLQNKK